MDIFSRNIFKSCNLVNSDTTYPTSYGHSPLELRKTFRYDQNNATQFKGKTKPFVSDWTEFRHELEKDYWDRIEQTFVHFLINDRMTQFFIA